MDSSYFIGEIRTFAFGFAPVGWMPCNGQMLSSTENKTLFAVIGNRFGGTSPNFALPDLNGRTVAGAGAGPGLTNYALGKTTGTTYVRLTESHLPAHTHSLNGGTGNPKTRVGTPSPQTFLANMAKNTTDGSGNITQDAARAFFKGGTDSVLHPTMVGITGASEPHDNRQPYLATSFYICVDDGVPPFAPESPVPSSPSVGNYVGEIRLFPFGQAPDGWALCNGATLPCQSNAALYSLILNTYGGQQGVNFMLPDLRGRIMVSTSGSEEFALGTKAGEEAVELDGKTMPSHSHVVQVMHGFTADQQQFEGNRMASLGKDIPALYVMPNVRYAVTLPERTIGTAGGSDPHQNIQPFLVLSYCIALSGTYPPRS